jgi:hypothetical protein
MKNRKNNLYTLGYFRKRLTASNIPSKVIVNKYAKHDIRYWSLVLFPRTHNIFCTCFKTDDKYYFELWDGGNKFKNKRLIETKSMNVIVELIYSVLLK